MNVERRYYACRSCGQTYCPWDDWAGVDSIQVTPHARRVITTVATAWSFDRSSRKLADLCAMRVSDDTIERVCQDEGERTRRWLRDASELTGPFERAPGEVEFYSDGLKINTTGGWVEMRLNLLQKRERGTGVGPAQWKDRVLPDATVRLASCAIANCRLVGAMWERWSHAFHLQRSRDLSMMGDGAAWIWEQARRRLSPHAMWCVDIYHVSEHLHACAKARFGEGEAARAWAAAELDELIRVGGPSYVRRLDELIAKEQDESGHRALNALRVYLDGNRDRMWYAERLKEGRPIGSGAIEGACKKIGARLKLNSARWKPRRAERFGALLCLEYTDQTDAYWRSRAA